MAVRAAAGKDDTIPPENIDKAINALQGKCTCGTQPRVMKRKEVIKRLGIHPRTLDYYLAKGFMQRVYGRGKRSIGISSVSFFRFMSTHRKAK